jgi:hypothetical protein
LTNGTEPRYYPKDFAPDEQHDVLDRESKDFPYLYYFPCGDEPSDKIAEKFFEIQDIHQGRSEHIETRSVS